MLIEFKVANYRSIRAEQTLSMVASNYSDELAQNLISCDHVPGLKGTKLVKAVALYGANASGKSNIVAALRFFAEFVRDSATKLQPGAPTGAQPFKLDPACLTQPSKFEITAVIKGIRTLYGIEMTRERVTSEYLVAYPKGRPQVWFERDWDAAKGKYKWSKLTEHFKHDAFMRDMLRPNVAFLSLGAQLSQAQFLTVYEALSDRLNFIDVPKNIHSKIEVDCPPWKTAAAITLGNDLSDAILSAVKNADIGVKAISAREIEPDVDELWPQYDDAMKDALRTRIREQGLLSFRIKFQHLDGIETGTFDISEESLGTQRFFSLLGPLLAAVIQPGGLVIDEIETSLHPKLIHRLIEIVFQASNKRGQLLFTTHNPLLLDQTLLRRDQIWFTEKDQEGATRLYPLTDFKPRKDESLVKGYLAGRYGGIPFIPEGLKF
ncbi:MAG: ATP-binding protein [Chthoniobacter sp.]|nr:ATP-binding protein [Chthoniobacter sp.]